MYVMDNVDKFNLWHWASTFYAHRVGNLSDTLKLSIFFVGLLGAFSLQTQIRIKLFGLTFRWKLAPLNMSTLTVENAIQRYAELIFMGEFDGKPQP